MTNYPYRFRPGAFLALALFTIPFPPAQAQDLQSCLEYLIQTEPYRTNFASMEQGLLDAGRLPSPDGAGYLQLARAAIEQGDLNYLLPPGQQVIEIPGPPSCPTPVTEPPTGLFKQLFVTLHTLQAAPDLSPDLIIQTFLDHFPAEDWEHPLTKHLFYAYVVAVVTADRGIVDRLPPWSDTEPAIEERQPRNVFSVLVDAENRLFVRGEEMPLDQLRAAAKLFITNPNKDSLLAESPTRAVIALQNYRGTSYQAYLAVYNELRDAYRELWNEYCQARFGRPYADDLPVELKKQLREAIPFMISESEPGRN